MFLNLGAVLGESREAALDAFLADLEERKPRLRRAIGETRVRHAHEVLLVAGGPLAARRAKAVRQEAVAYARREVRKRAPTE